MFVELCSNVDVSGLRGGKTCIISVFSKNIFLESAKV